MSKLCEQVKRGLAEIKADFCNLVIAEVDYIDRSNHSNLEILRPDQPLCNSTIPYYQKCMSYSHENEVRMLLFAGLDGRSQMAIDEHGVNIPVQTKEMFDEIWLPPNLAVWEKQIFQNLFGKYDLKINDENIIGKLASRRLNANNDVMSDR